MPDDAVHVRVRRETMLRRRAGVVVHWTTGHVDVARIDDAAMAIACLIDCAPRESAVIAMDSAINRGLITVADVKAICSSTSRGRAIARALDPASESGLETLARLRLRGLQVRVRTQVVIENVGRVDLLVGDRLVIELDGRAWHDRPGDFDADRRRDRGLVALGYLVLRASYAQVMGEWDVIEGQILGLVRSRKHLWPRESR
jgi:very-short-patch-repair endonuclease